MINDGRLFVSGAARVKQSFFKFAAYCPCAAYAGNKSTKSTFADFV